MERFIDACKRKDFTETLWLIVNDIIKVNETDDRGWTPLFWVSAIGDAAAALTLITKGTEVDTVARYGRTALAIAALNFNYDIVKHLVRNGADVNHVDEHGFSILSLYIHHMGELENRLEMIKLLESLGAKRIQPSEDSNENI